MKRIRLKAAKHVLLPNGQTLILTASVHGLPRGDSKEATLAGAICAAVVRGDFSPRTERVFR